MKHAHQPKGPGAAALSLLLPLVTLTSLVAFSPFAATRQRPDAAPGPARALVVATAETAGSPAVACRAVGSSYVSDDEIPIVIVDREEGESVNVWNAAGRNSLQRLQRTEKGRFLWFRLEGRDYVIRDSALLDRAREITEPQSKLGQAQGELGGVQGTVGGVQGSIGARQGEFGQRIGELARREGRLQSSLSRGRLSAAEERRLEAELERVRAERESIQSAMERLAAEQARMASSQSRLATRQASLARRQADMSQRVSKELKTLVREAVRTGKALRMADRGD